MQTLFSNYQPQQVDAREKYFAYQSIGKTQRFIKGRPVLDADTIQGFYTIEWACNRFSLCDLPSKYIENQLKDKVAAYFYKNGSPKALFSFIDLLATVADFVSQIKLPSCEKYAAKITTKIKRAADNSVDTENAISKISEFYWDIDNAELGATLAEAVFGDAEFYDNYNKQLLDYRDYCGGNVFAQIAEVEKFLLYFSQNKQSIATNAEATKKAINLYFSYLS